MKNSAFIDLIAIDHCVEKYCNIEETVMSTISSHKEI